MHILFFFAIFMVFSAHGFSGEKGNGGVSVVCRNDAQIITSAELLDIYEGRILYKRQYVVDLNDTEELLQMALQRISKFEEFHTRLIREIKAVKKGLIFVSAENELEATEDAFPPVKKKNCRYEQLANYRSSDEVIVSQEIYDSLDNVNKAALILHEAIYSLRRKSVGDNTSTTSRKFVAHLMAANSDSEAISLLIKDTLYRPVNNRSCGNKGTLEERIESCSFVQRLKHHDVVLVSRNTKKYEIWYDLKYNLLWTDRWIEEVNYENAHTVCKTEKDLTSDLPDYEWRLPTASEYRNNAFAYIYTLPNISINDREYWFWTSTETKFSVQIYNILNGQLSSNPFKKMHNSVRCVASLPFVNP